MVIFRSVLAWTALLSLAAAAAVPEPGSGVVGAPVNGNPSKPVPKCKEIIKRRAWHKLSKKEKKAYIDAVLCLMTKPTKTNLPFAKNHFDDFIKMHQVQANRVHGDGWFLPFHRMQMTLYEQALRSECKYRGAQPYWDETLDAGAFSKAAIFDPIYGFGGNGYGDQACIQDGPFASYVLTTGPGHRNVPHCIWRQINDDLSISSGQKYIDRCLELKTYAEAWPCIENGLMPGDVMPPLPPGAINGEFPPWPPGNISMPSPGPGVNFTFLFSPHNGGHGGVGGEMANPVSSPGDPLFYLHHTYLDRIWWQWQKRDLKKRLVDIAGYTSQVPLAGVPGGWVNATLDDELNMLGIGPNVTVRDTMDIRAWPLCFDYE